MKAGSFFPSTSFSSLYAMAGDDCSLFYDLNELTEKQQADHESNVELTAMLQVALSCIGHGGDHLALYDEYRKPELQQVLIRYHGFFEQMMDDVVPMNHFSYHPKYDYYKSVSAMIEAQPDLTDVANLYMVSGSNSVIHKDPRLFEISRNLNSKKHFEENAPGFGIPTPDTLVVTKADLSGKEVKAFFQKHDYRVVVKLLGLAGARNVAMVDSVTECAGYVAQYGDDMVVLLQQRLPLDFYTEMTVDLFVSDSDIHIANTRKILFAEGLWVGNLIGRSVNLTDEQQAVLLNVGEYASSHGYVSQEGGNCGVDFFVGNDGSVVVTEINARWTGGLFPAEILSRLNDDRDAVAFFDVVTVEKRQAYVDFIEKYLVGRFDGSFAMVPVGFGCFEIDMAGLPCFYTWQVVLGDLEVFKKTKREELGEGAMMTADIITLT